MKLKLFLVVMLLALVSSSVSADMYSDMPLSDATLTRQFHATPGQNYPTPIAPGQTALVDYRLDFSNSKIITHLVYDKSQINTSEQVLQQGYAHNCGETATTMTVNLSQTVNDSTAISSSDQVNVKVGFKASAGVILASAEVSGEIGYGHTWGSQTTTGTSVTKSISQAVTVPAHSSILVSLSTVSHVANQVPYVMDLVYMGPGITQLGIYFGGWHTDTPSYNWAPMAAEGMTSTVGSWNTIHTTGLMTSTTWDVGESVYISSAMPNPDGYCTTMKQNIPVTANDHILSKAPRVTKDPKNKTSFRLIEKAKFIPLTKLKKVS